mmetsp:Transcript_22064/g.37549  ORF Transcript_22064/g.37549 Transcript_22064/m.37549 type:complete len:121 (-) Transcript_22064:4-366(-)
MVHSDDDECTTKSSSFSFDLSFLLSQESSAVTESKEEEEEEDEEPEPIMDADQQVDRAAAGELPSSRYVNKTRTSEIRKHFLCRCYVVRIPTSTSSSYRFLSGHHINHLGTTPQQTQYRT